MSIDRLIALGPFEDGLTLVKGETRRIGAVAVIVLLLLQLFGFEQIVPPPTP